VRVSLISILYKVLIHLSACFSFLQQAFCLNFAFKTTERKGELLNIALYLLARIRDNFRLDKSIVRYFYSVT